MENKMKKVLMLICILFVSILFWGSPLTVSAATITLNTTTSYLVKGETTSLQFTGTSKKVTWTSDTIRIATVTNSGLVKGVGIGTTYIIAKTNKKTYKYKIIVIKPTEINFTSSRDAVVVGGSPVSINPESDEYSTSSIKKWELAMWYPVIPVFL